MKLALLSLALLTTISLAEEPAVTSFKQLAKEIPQASTFKSSGRSFTITTGEVDVRKTTSLTTPVVGEVDCAIVIDNPAVGSATMDLRFEFSWKDGKWHFERVVNKRSRKDITKLPMGQDMLTAGALRDFLARYGQ